MSSPPHVNAELRPLALVTGASSGLGAEFARQLAAKGFALILAARRRDRLEALAQELTNAHGIAAEPVIVDLSRTDAREIVAQAIAGREHRISMLVNNAGYSIPEMFAATPWERQGAKIITLAYSVASLSHLILPAMLAEKRGSIINVASVAGFAPGVAGHTLYPATKSFVIKFTQALDCEVRAQGIKVTALCPGYTTTEFHAASGMSDLVEKAPRRIGDDPAQVVRAALAANSAGRVIVVTGARNKLSRLALKILPEGITRPLINYGARRYRRDV